MKTIVTVIAVVLLLAFLILGVEKTISYAKGGKRIINEEIDHNSPMRLEVARIQALMSDESEKIISYESKIGNLVGRVEQTKQRISDQSRNFGGEKKLLIKIKELLDNKKEKYVIGGQEYSFAEVSNDALSRVEACKKMEQDIGFQGSIVRDLTKAMGQGKKLIAEARTKHSELSAKLEHLKARNQNANIRLEVATLTAGLTDASFAPNSELVKSFKNYEDRVSQKESRAAAMLSQANTAHLIDYSTSVVVDDAATEIGNYLSPGATQANPEKKEQASKTIAQAFAIEK